MKRLNIFLFVLVSFSYMCLAQDITGNLEGNVINDEKNPLANVNIMVQSESLQGTRGASTDEKGNFIILALPAGTYNVKLSSIGFQGLIYQKVQIQLGKTSNLGEITLQQQNYNLPDIVVSSDKPFIDPSSSAYGGNLTSKDFQDLPLDRNYQSIAALLPNANTSYLGDEINIAGATGGENKYFIDGVDATDTFLGATGTKLPYNFIREIEVRGGGYEADLSDFTKWHTKFILDLFHVASQQKPVDIKQHHYFRLDDNGNPIFLNRDYGRALRYQPAMSVRLGIETIFKNVS